VEQTFRITHRRHESHLHSLVSDFTQYGYSVRWKVVKLARWGAAQDRKRLIIVAAAPGKTLPTFPADTHSLNRFSRTLPYTTVRDAIAGVRPGDDLHDIDGTASQPYGTRLDANRLTSTITYSNVQLHHPSEARNLTLRELACLQGFPINHHFLRPATKIRRQIGNAFPPNAIRVLFQHLGEWLLSIDREEAGNVNSNGKLNDGKDGILHQRERGTAVGNLVGDFSSISRGIASGKPLEVINLTGSFRDLSNRVANREDFRVQDLTGNLN